MSATCRRCRGGRAGKESGQALVEMLIALPLLLLLLAAVIGFGRIMFVGLAVDQAAFSGGRFAAESLSVEQVGFQAYRATAWNLSSSGLDPGRADWRLYAGRWGRGNEVRNRVAVAVSVSDLPLAPAIFGEPVILSQESAFRIERWKSRWR